MPEETIRAFIAIELPQEIKDALEELQHMLKKTGADVKWVEPDNIHLTLKFLGDTDVAALDKINESLSKIAAGFSAFEATLSGLGTFPPGGSPRVVWAGLKDKENACGRIAQAIEEEMQRLGFPKEKREFKSHLTLGRVRSSLNLLKLADEIKSRKDHFSGAGRSFRVSSLSLIKSTLTPKGSIYETLFRANLSAI
ncbi:MAG: RNA 2',3'-cyclic phosphodiesterase [Candidatus Omnitrophica bacterium]|nr:RNA 2',3'-cyclic phosphodiesterase [Candidatus Omnitrophota bacterium]